DSVDSCRLVIVRRFEGFHCCPSGQKREDRSRQSLSGTGGVDHLGGLDSLAEITFALSRDGLEQLRKALPRCVLVEPGTHRLGGGVDELGGRLRARGALTEGDGAELCATLGHLAGDRLTDGAVGIGQSRGLGHGMPQPGAADIGHQSFSFGATRASRSRAASWRRELLATALPPKGPGTPAVFVNAPPASVTMGTRAPMS